MALPSFCAPPDPRPHLAALGVLSVAAGRDGRDAIRETWMAGHRDGPSGIVPRFVLRGLGADAETWAESAAHGDMVLLEANASLNRVAGPLTSLLGWFECALVAWPNATLLGRSEADVWLHLPGLAARLRLDLASLRRSVARDDGPLTMYWGGERARSLMPLA